MSKIIRLKTPLIGYKKVVAHYDGYGHLQSYPDLLVKLLIPVGALVAVNCSYCAEWWYDDDVNGHRHDGGLCNIKMRASSAKVLWVRTYPDGTSWRGKKTRPRLPFHTEYHYINYVKGKTVRPHKFSRDTNRACGPGIHFFLNRLTAEHY